MSLGFVQAGLLGEDAAVGSPKDWSDSSIVVFASVMLERLENELETDIVDSYNTVEWFGASQALHNQEIDVLERISYLESDIPMQAV